MTPLKFAPLRQKKRNFDFAPGHRLINPETGKYLHFSGSGETDNVDYSWRGYRHQAETLKASADAWPYQEEKA
jgi:hypothetical protein